MLLLACSKNKDYFLPSGRAIDVYTGQLFRQGIKWARKHEHAVLILSAKYGFIHPETIIEPYDLVMRRYDGPWPDGEGFYLGGQHYFKLVPERFQPLVPKATYCFMSQSMRVLLNA